MTLKQRAKLFPVQVGLVVVVLVLSCSCISKLSQSVTELVPASNEKVEAVVDGFGILGLTYPQLRSEGQDKLLAKCNGRGVVNINSELRMRNWFVVQFYTLQLAGECK